MFAFWNLFGSCFLDLGSYDSSKPKTTHNANGTNHALVRT